jgi:manganese transport protein
VALGLAAFLGWIALYPYRQGWKRALVSAGEEMPAPAPLLPRVRYRRIGVAVEFAGADDAVLAQAADLARSHGAEVLLVHVVEGLPADWHGAEAADEESRKDRTRMAALTEHLRAEGLPVRGLLGYGSPPEELTRLAREQELDLLVLGTHGHGFFADLALGQTVSPVLHRLNIPILVVPTLRH